MQVHHHPRVHFLLPVQPLTMKSSHYKTPRTMAECEFVVGYPIIEQHNSSEWRMAAVCIGVVLAILWIFR
jgi:hypothetical protein